MVLIAEDLVLLERLEVVDVEVTDDGALAELGSRDLRGSHSVFIMLDGGALGSSVL